MISSNSSAHITHIPCSNLGRVTDFDGYRLVTALMSLRVLHSLYGDEVITVKITRSLQNISFLSTSIRERSTTEEPFTSRMISPTTRPEFFEMGERIHDCYGKKSRIIDPA